MMLLRRQHPDRLLVLGAPSTRRAESQCPERVGVLEPPDHWVDFCLGLWAMERAYFRCMFHALRPVKSQALLVSSRTSHLRRRVAGRG